jgi:hypothetical protein
MEAVPVSSLVLLTARVAMVSYNAEYRGNSSS